MAIVKNNGNKAAATDKANRIAKFKAGRDALNKQRHEASVATKAKAAAKATVVVTSNPRLVAAIKGHVAAMDQAKSYLLDMAVIVQEEQLTKNEVVASLIEARGIEKSTAESQYSRIKGILNSPEAIEKLQTGEWDLKTARANTVNGQKNPSTTKKAENAEKRLSKAVSVYVIAVKELGMDFNSAVSMVKVALKKQGVK